MQNEKVQASFRTGIGSWNRIAFMSTLVYDLPQLGVSTCSMCDICLHVFSVSDVRLAKLQGALDAIEAVKTGVEQHARMAEKTAIQFFSSLRAALDSREQAVLKVPSHSPWVK